MKALAPHISLVVSQPDRPSGRGNRLQPTPVKAAALELGLPVEAPEKSRAPEFVDRLRAEDADAFLVAAYGQILSTKVLEASHRGSINLHGSILPEYRGAAPIQRCILEGRSETGVTLMQMDKGMDTGDMIAVIRRTIDPDITYGDLQDQLAQDAAQLALEWMPRIVAGDYPREVQDSERATYAPKIEKAEAEMSFNRPADREYDRFRAFNPSPGPFISTSHGRLRLSRMARVEGSGAPGTVLTTTPNLIVAFAEGALEFVELQPEGKKRMSGRDFANGARLRAGDCLLP